MRRPLVFVVIALAAIAAGSVFTTHVDSVPLYSARTGNQCQSCHFDPNGGGPRTPLGFLYERNRHSLDAEQNVKWKDAQPVNQIGENMPVFLGVNQRFMLLTTSEEGGHNPDRIGFFNMENALHIAFKPHDWLTLVYAYDAFSSTGSAATAVVRDAFGILRLPSSVYLKAGRIRNPFGLRMDDHTVATRNGFLDFSTGDRVLPYDPRYQDLGVEIGGERGPVFARASFTNGSTDVFSSSPFAETGTIKLGYDQAWYHGGVSFYDSYDREPIGSAPKRATRWGYYTMAGYGPFALVGEVVAGTDEAEPAFPGTVTGAKTNRLGAFAELNYAPIRYLNARVRYDYLDADRSSDPIQRKAATHRRYAFEAEYVPVPFCELRATVRRIMHDDELAFGYPDQTQAYLQFHFSY